MRRGQMISENLAEKDRPALSLRNLLRCFVFLGGYAPLVVVSLVFCTICVWAELALMREAGRLIDRENLLTSPLWPLAAPFLYYGLLNRIFGGLQWTLTVYATNRATLRLRERFFHKLQNLSKSFYDRHKSGWLVARNSSDIGRIQEFLTYPMMMLVIFFTTFVFAIEQILRISPILLLPMLLSAPAFVVLTFYFRKHMGQAQRKASEQNSRIVANISETVHGIRVIHAFWRQSDNFEKFSRLNDENREVNIRLARLGGLFRPSLDFLGILNMTLVIAFSFWLIGRGHLTAAGTPMTPGDVAQYVLYMNAILHPLRILTELYGLAIGTSAAAERIFEILDMPPEIADAPAAPPAPTLRGEYELKDLSFRYSSDSPWVLRGIDLHIPAGQTLAIVGQTGAGKTTLASLLARFYDPVEGAVLIDGHDLRSFRLESFQRQLGFVPQQGYLFTGTVLENLLFATDGLSAQEVVAAATELGTHETIAALQNGYETQVMEGGEGLSLGQRQIIAITRAVLADPAVLIMDEPTSALDVFHERIVQRALERIARRRTTIIIAHRLSTVERADKIVVLRNGAIVESGTHGELLAMGKTYHTIYRSGDNGVLGG